MRFAKWLDLLIKEKGIDPDAHVFEKDGESGVNHIPLLMVLQAIKAAPPQEQAAIKTGLTRVDFTGGNIVDFFDHLAGALAV